MTTEIKDFGQKIGGARKDFYNKALGLDDLDSMTTLEIETLVTKANIWPKPDYAQMVADGMPIGVAYFKKRVRDAAQAKPKYLRRDLTLSAKKARVEQYIATVETLKEIIDEVKTFDDVEEAFGKFFIDNEYLTGGYGSYKFMYTPKGSDNPVVSNRLFKAMYFSNPALITKLLNDEAVRKGFLISKPRSSNTKRKQTKKRFTPVQLISIERTGIDYRNGRDVTGDDYLEVFNFKGGEFGNWLNQNDRQESMNMAYDAILDLARTLEISNSDISLDGTLSIAFGSRGRANTAAHYEPLRHVINLTKMKGAGSLAHEWFHALDFYIGELKGSTKAITEDKYRWKPACELVNIIFSCHEYYANSRQMDREHSKFGVGYWSDIVEMTARAFSCYVMDRLSNKSDYLVGHSETFHTQDGKPVYPVAEERVRIDSAFDDFFEALKSEHILGGIVK